MSHKKFYAEAATAKEKQSFEKFLSEDEELVIATGFGKTYMRHQFIYYILFPGGLGFIPTLVYCYIFEYNLAYGLLVGLILACIIAWMKSVHLYNANRYLLTTRRVILKNGVLS